MSVPILWWGRPRVVKVQRLSVCRHCREHWRKGLTAGCRLKSVMQRVDLGIGVGPSGVQSHEDTSTWQRARGHEESPDLRRDGKDGIVPIPSGTMTLRLERGPGQEL